MVGGVVGGGRRGRKGGEGRGCRWYGGVEINGSEKSPKVDEKLP